MEDLQNKTAAELKELALEAISKNDRAMLAAITRVATARLSASGRPLPTTVSEATRQLYRQALAKRCN